MNEGNAYGSSAQGSGSSTQNIKDTATRARDSFREQSAVVRDDLRELARTGGSAARELADEARTIASEKLRQGQERLAGTRDRVASYIEEHPMKSVLIAVGAGALLGALLTRRS